MATNGPIKPRPPKPPKPPIKPGAGARATRQVKINARLGVDPNAVTSAERAGGSYYGEAYGAISNKEKRKIQLGQMKPNKKTKAQRTEAKTKLLTKETSAEAKRAQQLQKTKNQAKSLKTQSANLRNARNKMKAQGAKIDTWPTSGFNRRGKK